MELLALPAFADNYIWMLHDGQQALVVDPGDSAPVAQLLDAHGLSLAGILVTHHHHDHVDGIAALLPRLAATGGQVFGPAREALPVPHNGVQDGDTLQLMGCSITVLDVPGHTAGHVAFFHDPSHIRPGDAPILFCGDTLFSAGCGRLREGTPAQMHHSLSRLNALPEHTRVCCAHEYTLANLAFAQAVEPDNTDIADHIRRCETWRCEGRATLPSTIALERRINPFMRCDQPAAVRAARAHGATHDAGPDVFAALRQWKNIF